MPKVASFLAVVYALACWAPKSARAESPSRLSIAAAGSCPSAQEVEVELHELMPEVALELSDDVTASDVVVADRGAGFSIKVRGQRRRFREQKRDCTERARHIAVFTVLVVDPLRVPSNAPPEPEPEPEPEPHDKPAEKPVDMPTEFVPPETSSGRPATFDLALGPIAQVAASDQSQGTTQAGGLGLRLRYGGGVGISLGLAGLLPTSLHFRTAQARAFWEPMDLSLSLAHRVDSWELMLDLGLAGALLIVEGEAMPTTQLAARLEVGGRAGVQVRYWASDRAGIYFGLSGTFFPKPYTLQVEGLGVVGKTPTAWAGGSIGAVIRL